MTFIGIYIGSVEVQLSMHEFLFIYVYQNKCTIYDATFSNKVSLTRHLDSVHERKIFTEKDPLNGHQNSVHDGTKQNKCTICAATFSNKIGLTIHLKNVHERKMLKCTNCDGSFKSTEDMIKHIESVHKD